MISNGKDELIEWRFKKSRCKEQLQMLNNFTTCSIDMKSDRRNYNEIAAVFDESDH